MNPVLKTIAERSSIRAYREETLKEEEINALLTAGLQAPPPEVWGEEEQE